MFGWLLYGCMFKSAAVATLAAGLGIFLWLYVLGLCAEYIY